MNPEPAGLQELQNVVGNIISSIVGLGIISMFVMLALAGYKYLRSGGDPKSLEAAKSTITWALLGIVFMAVTWLVLQLIETATDVKITSFNIGALCNALDSSNKIKDWCVRSP